MSQKLNKQYAGELLDRVKELDRTTSTAFYEIGRILSSIQYHGLHDVLGYESFGAMIEEELSFSPEVASRYVRTYRHFRRLHYTKTEAVDLVMEFSWTKMADILPHLTDKIGKRAVKARIEDWATKQINFQLERSALEELQHALIEHGAELSESGKKLLHSSDALMNLVRTRMHTDAA